MSEDLAALIAATRELQALPSTTMDLMRLLDDPAVGAGAVLAVIEKDPSLTANLLKLCNSAYYGLRGRVGSLREALVLLGNQAIISLAFATSMGDVLRGPLGAYHLERDELWHHALATAVGAAHLAGVSEVPGLRERAFTGGLVHDVGKLLLNGPLKRQLRVLPPGGSEFDLLRTERELLGFDHAEAGAALGRAWNFPRGLVHIIATHHVPQDDPDASREAGDPGALMARAVALANLAAVLIGHGDGTGRPSDVDYYDAAESLGFTVDQAEELLERIPAFLVGLIGPQGEPA